MAVALAFVAMLTGPMHHALVDHGHEPKPKPEGARSESSKTPSKSEGIDEKQPQLAYLEPLRLAFGASDDTQLDQILKQYNERHDLKLEFAIVTAPDPGETAVDYIFDRVIDSVLRASQRLRYTSDRFYFPWLTDKTDKVTISRGVPGTILLRTPRKTDEEKEIARSYLVLFVVGESPTWGIDSAAFATAVAAIRKYSPCPPRAFYSPQFFCLPQPAYSPQRIEEIKVLGPYFSGSSKSLRDGIVTARSIQGNEMIKFNIVSGSTTSGGIRRILEGADKNAQSETTFVSTQVPDSRMKEAIFKHILDSETVEVVPTMCGDGTTIYRQLKGVALVVESSSSFGQSNLASIGIDPETNKEKEGPPDYNCNHNKDELAAEYILPYPMHISQVRSAWERQRGKSERDPNGPPSPVLELSLEDLTLARDVPPSLSAKTSYSEELNLAQVFYTICNKDISYVGLVTSDTSDRMFLVREIRKRCPDVQVFVTSADVLYAHPDYRTEMSGLLIASSYPLVSESQTWTDRGGERFLRQFASSGAEGVYNAFVVLFDEQMHPALIDYGMPLKAPDAGPRLHDTPQIWITTVGNSAFWPLSVQTPRARDARPSTEPRTEIDVAKIGASGKIAETNKQPAKELPRGTYIEIQRSSLVKLPVDFDPPAAWLFALTVSAVLVLILSSSAISSAIGNERPLTAFFAASEAGPEHWLYVSSFFCAIFAAYASAWPIISFNGWNWLEGVHRNLQFIEVGLCWLGAGFAFLAVGTAIWAYIRDSRQTIGQSASPTALVTAGLSGAAALTLPLIKPFYVADMQASLFLWQRATYLLNGVSPIIPIGAAIFIICAWSWLNLRRLRFSAEILAFGETSGTERATAFWEDLRTSQIHVRDSLRSPFRHGFIGVAVVLLGLLSVIASLGKHLLVLEGPRERMFFLVLIAAGFFVATLTIVWAFALWHDVRRLLICLSVHPLGLALKRLPTSFSRIVGGKVESATRLRYGEHVAARLLFELQTQRAEAGYGEPELDDYLARIHDDLHLDGTGGGRSLTTRKALHAISELLVDRLRPFWREWRLAEHLPSSEERHAGGSPSQSTGRENAWLSLAEQIVALDVSFSLFALSRWILYMLSVATATSLALLVLVNSYPFQPHRLLLVEVALVFGALVVIALLLLLQMGRDEVLSNISNTTPGEVTWDKDFIVNVVVLVVLPVAGLITSQLPDVSNGLVAASDALMRVLK